jgi:hypothetical protein
MQRKPPLTTAQWRQHILNVLTDNPEGLHSADIRTNVLKQLPRQAQRDDRLVPALCKAMVRSGHLTRAGQGRYRIAATPPPSKPRGRPYASVRTRQIGIRLPQPLLARIHAYRTQLQQEQIHRRLTRTEVVRRLLEQGLGVVDSQLDVLP